MLEIVIDPEFKSVIPPLDKEEYRGLTEDIVADGCRESIVVWNKTIIDGHNRYSICKENNIPFTTIDYSSKFQTRDEVIDWMLRNQLNKRNLKPDVIAYLRGEQYNRRKELEGAKPKHLKVSELPQSEVVTKHINITNVPTAATVAKEQGVGHATVERDAAYNNAVKNVVQTVGMDSVKQKILDGTIKAARKDIIELAKATPEVQKEIITKSLERETNIKTLLNEEKRQQQISDRNIAIPERIRDTDSDLKNMDCIDYLKTLQNDSVDLVLTDPPYEISRETGFKDMTNGVDRLGVSMEFGEWDNPGNVNLDAVIRELFRVTKKGGTAIIFYDLWKITLLQEMMINAGFKQLRFIEWVKKNPVPLNSKINYLTNAREIALVGIKGSNPKFHSEYDNGIYSHPIYHSKHRIHPTQKPVELMCDLIEKHSDVGDVVADVFLGSGTTVVAAMKKHRKCIGCEIDSKMYARMTERIADVA